MSAQAVQCPESCTVFPNREGCKYSVRIDRLVDDQSLDVLFQVGREEGGPQLEHTGRQTERDRENDSTRR